LENIMDHLDVLLNESSPTTYAGEPAVARELRVITAHTSRRFRPVAIIGIVAALVLSAGAVTASAADSPDTVDAEAVVVEITDDECEITVHVGDQTQVVDVNDLPAPGSESLVVLDATVRDGDLITVTVIAGPDEASCIN
jgi:hypothetical protein